MAGEELIGTVLGGRYKIISYLGEGAMGMVLKAEDELTGTPVAIKLLKEGLAQNETMAARFRREARSAARIHHPNAMAIYEVGEFMGHSMYMAMEFIDGPTLTDILDKREFLPPEEALRIMIQVSRGVAAAHRLGVIHRDLKPDNIVVVDSQPFPIVKVLDFGLAKSIQSDSPEENITINNEVLGTPVYMSPEQCAGRKLTTASDVYALGIVFYETLTGLVPFDDKNPVQVMIAHQVKEPTPPSKMLPEANIPPQMEEILLKCLQKNPEARYPSASELSDALLSLHGELYPSTHEVLLDFLESLWEDDKTHKLLHRYTRISTALGRASLFITAPAYMKLIKDLRSIEAALANLKGQFDTTAAKFASQPGDMTAIVPDLKYANATLHDDRRVLVRILSSREDLEPLLLQAVFPHIPYDSTLTGRQYLEDLNNQIDVLQTRLHEVMSKIPSNLKPHLSELDNILIQRFQLIEDLEHIIKRAVEMLGIFTGSPGFDVLKERIVDSVKMFALS